MKKLNRSDLQTGNVIEYINGYRHLVINVLEGIDANTLGNISIYNKTLLLCIDAQDNDNKTNIGALLDFDHFYLEGIKCVYEDYKLDKIIWKQQILTEDEKIYLKNVIEPFKKHVLSICKICDETFKGNEMEHIEIDLSNSDYASNLPSFISGTMFSGMELDREYTLEELNL